MSITSVGASFGYIDPNTVAGVTQSAPVSNDTDDSSASDDSGNQSPTVSTPSSPPPAAPQATSSSGPKFAPDTGSALMTVQEKANAA
jgi:hypothetical protein